MAQHLPVEIMFTLKGDEMALAIMLAENALAIDILVLQTKEAPHQFLLLRSNRLERMLLHLTEGFNHGLVHLEILVSIHPLVAELLSAHPAHHQQTSHLEGRIHQDAGYAP